jgi:hypothetical protein
MSHPAGRILYRGLRTHATDLLSFAGITQLRAPARPLHPCPGARRQQPEPVGPPHRWGGATIRPGRPGCRTGGRDARPGRPLSPPRSRNGAADDSSTSSAMNRRMVCTSLSRPRGRGSAMNFTNSSGRYCQRAPREGSGSRPAIATCGRRPVREQLGTEDARVRPSAPAAASFAVATRPAAPEVDDLLPNQRHAGRRADRRDGSQHVGTPWNPSPSS